jgi:hypothetical protein
MLDQPEAVPPDGADILNEARSFMTRFVAFPSPAAADLAVLWAAHTHAVGADDKIIFDSTPRLFYGSDLPGSGKSRALELTAALSRKPALMSDCTGPSMHTLISNGAALFIDELDLILGSGDSARPVRACVNAGYRRSGQVARNKGMASVFAPVALAGLATVFTRNPLLAPTRDRAIVVTMKPNAGRITLDSWRERLHRSAANSIAEAMGGWARSELVSLVTVYPDMPADCTDRNLDLFEPLATIAAVAGQDWPARFAAVWEEFGASTGSTEPSMPPGMALIRDIRSIWPDGATRVSTSALVSGLMSMPGSVWPSVWRDAAQVPNELAAALRPYGIAPERRRPAPGAASVQCYLRSAFELPADQPDQGDQGVAA